jgi:hypothetical protein
VDGGDVSGERLTEIDDERARFLKIYNNLPLEERKQVVLVLENEPISWEIARNEILHNSERGEEILQKLIVLKII